MNFVSFFRCWNYLSLVIILNFFLMFTYISLQLAFCLKIMFSPLEPLRLFCFKTGFKASFFKLVINWLVFICITAIKKRLHSSVLINSLHAETKLHEFNRCAWVHLEVISQQTFQRCFNVVFRLVRRRDVRPRQINVEPTLCILTLEFTMSNNVESMLCISTLIWTTLDNVETTLSFSTLICTTLVNIETAFWKWQFLKRTKQIISNWIHEIGSFNYYFMIFFTLLMSKSTCKAAKTV